MDLMDFIQRQSVPLPWAEGEKIPWNEPGFSQRMLREHLSQAHDAASRRFETIDRQVEWIQRAVLSNQPARILDLGCGPGFYSSRLARLGNVCIGIDFSPASIAYAWAHNPGDPPRCAFVQADIRTANFGHGFGLGMLIYGEFNVFRPAEVRSILINASQALTDGGQLLLEVHPFAVIRAIGEEPSSWYSSENGLFSDQPHICLTEHFWDAQQNVATNRYFVLDAQTGQVTRFADSMQAYTDDQYRALLQECGFTDIVFYPSLTGDPHPGDSSLIVILCKKGKTA